jgi:hypothetical protein
MTRKSPLTLVATAIATVLSLSAPAFADALDGAARVDQAGKLRMLSQRIPASMCNFHAGIEAETARKIMKDASAEYDRIASALTYGDPGLKIFTPETDPIALRDIGALQAVWGPIRARVWSFEQREPTAEDLSILATASEDLLKAAQQLVISVRSDDENENPIPQASALTIDIAGRQRMLAQRMNKNACLILEGRFETNPVAELGSAMETYGASLWALRFGMKDAGIIAPPNATIGNGLEDIAVDWATLAPILASIREGATVDNATRALVYNGLNTLTGKMNTVVGQYVEATGATS